MIIGVARVVLDMPEGLSLKDKRGPIRSLIARLRTTFNIAVAEVDALDAWQTAILGLAVVSNDERHANEMLSKAVAFIDNNLSEGSLADYEIEITHLLA